MVAEVLKGVHQRRLRGKPGLKLLFIIGIFARLKPRGVPAFRLWLFMGKWPLLLASEREGAI